MTDTSNSADTVTASRLHAAEQQADALRTRNHALTDALRDLATRVRDMDEDLRKPPPARQWKTGLVAAGALRGAWIEATKTLNGETVQ